MPSVRWDGPPSSDVRTFFQLQHVSSEDEYEKWESNRRSFLLPDIPRFLLFSFFQTKLGFFVSHLILFHTGRISSNGLWIRSLFPSFSAILVLRDSSKLHFNRFRCSFFSSIPEAPHRFISENFHAIQSRGCFFPSGLCGFPPKLIFFDSGNARRGLFQ